MVGADPDGHVVCLVLTVGLARRLADGVQDPAVGVDLEHIVHALHHAGEPLQPHAGIDIFLFQFGIVAVPVVIELGKDVVPDLHIPVAVAAGTAVGRAAAVLCAAVEIDLGAGTAGTRAVFPEVVGFAEFGDALGGDADHLVPELERLVVALVHRRPEQLRRDGEPVGRGQELPRPRNCLAFEVIPERKVPQHLEKRAVPRGVSDPLEVGRADALLASGHPPSRGLLLAGKVLFHRRHARVDEQERFVPVRYERKARETEMPLALEEREILFAQVVKRRPFHLFSVLPRILSGTTYFSEYILYCSTIYLSRLP